MKYALCIAAMTATLLLAACGGSRDVATAALAGDAHAARRRPASAPPSISVRPRASPSTRC